MEERKPPEKKRTSQFVVRTNEREQRIIREKAEKVGLTVSEYIRSIAIYGEAVVELYVDKKLTASEVVKFDRT